MKLFLSRNSLLIILISALCVGFTSCGKAKKDEEKVISISSSTGETTTEQDIKTVTQLYDIYVGESGLDKTKIANIANKLKPELESMFGMSFDVNQIIDAVASAAPSIKTNGVTPKDIAGAMFSHLPMLNWFTNNAELTDTDLKNKLKDVFKNSSEPAVNGLLSILKRFDEKWLGGNENGQYNLKELSFPILILNALANVDMLNGIELNFQLPIGQLESTLAKKQIELKMEQQIFGRYSGNTNYSTLSPTDKKIENITLSLQFYITTLVIRSYGDGGKIDSDKFEMAFKAINGIYSDQIYESFHLYDRPMFAGDEDGKLNLIEFFNLSQDLLFVQKFNSKKTKDPAFVGNLYSIFPTVGEEIMSYENLYDEKNSNPDSDSKDEETNGNIGYFDSVNIFDKPSFGGNSDGQLNEYERLMAFTYLRILDVGFDLCDTDKNRLISRPELKTLFGPKKLSVPVKDIEMDAFFLNIIPDKNSSKYKLLKEGLKIKLGNSEKKNQQLNAAHLYVRLVKVLPYFLKSKTTE